MLDRIVRNRRRELDLSKMALPLPQLLDQLPEERFPSFIEAITADGINIIAEIKYQSPSHGRFACQLPEKEIGRIYARNGAVAISVLTEKHYFEGDLEFLVTLRKAELHLPLLRKDFILDRYQVAESRYYGASAYLLIVSIVSRSELHDLIAYGKEFDLDTLVEVHDPFELEVALEADARLIGVNNRNLRTFEVNINTSFDLAKRMEQENGYTLVSESGISEHLQIDELRDAGFSAFLIGSVLMDSKDPGKKLRELLDND